MEFRYSICLKIFDSSITSIISLSFFGLFPWERTCFWFFICWVVLDCSLNVVTVLLYRDYYISSIITICWMMKIFISRQVGLLDPDCKLCPTFFGRWFRSRRVRMRLVQKAQISISATRVFVTLIWDCHACIAQELRWYWLINRIKGSFVSRFHLWYSPQTLWPAGILISDSLCQKNRFHRLV